MKKAVLLLLILSGSLSTIAQINTVTSKRNLNKKKRRIDRPVNCPDLYVTTSTGINNNTSILGFSFDLPVRKAISIEAGVGVGYWGYKIALSGKYYFSPCQRGFALGGGITYSTGVVNRQTKWETVTGSKESVQLTLYPQTNAFAAAYYYLNIGKRNNRIYAQAGWSYGFANKKFIQTSGNTISNNTTTTINSLCPGGPIAAIGLSFGINNY